MHLFWSPSDGCDTVTWHCSIVVLTFPLAAHGFQISVPGLSLVLFSHKYRISGFSSEAGRDVNWNPLLTLAFLVDFASQLSAEKDTDKFYWTWLWFWDMINTLWQDVSISVSFLPGYLVFWCKLLWLEVIRMGYECHSHLSGWKVHRKANPGKRVRQISLNGKVLDYCR